jgi:hypothetical protein
MLICFGIRWRAHFVTVFWFNFPLKRLKNVKIDPHTQIETFEDD